jgi:hypothetical protein
MSNEQIILITDNELPISIIIQLLLLLNIQAQFGG